MRSVLVCSLLWLPFLMAANIEVRDKRQAIEKSFFYQTYLSKDWRSLYNYFADECTRMTAASILKWTDDCIYVCDKEGNPRFLDRQKNSFDVGIGSFRLSGDSELKLYADDSCPDGFDKRSLIDIKYDTVRADSYALICNDDSKVEFLSLRFSRCPSGSYFEQKNETIAQPDIGGDCTLHNAADNSTYVVLKHGEVDKIDLSGYQKTMCWFHYCCDAIYYTTTAACNLSDFCEKQQAYEDAYQGDNK